MSASDIGNNVAHIILGFTFVVGMIALTTVEVYFLNVSTTGLLFIVAQNVGLGIANSYYVSNVVFNGQGLSETTQASAGTKGAP